MKKICLLIIMTILLSSVAVMALESVILSDQGSGVKYKTNGSVASGDLEVTIWNTSQSTGTPIYNETFPNAIVNGSWQVILGENSSNNLTLEYMGLYYKDYKIAGEDADFGQFNGSVTERQVFNSPLGDIHQADFNTTSNLSISNLTMGGSILFALGEMVDNLVDGIIQITGDLNVSGNITATGGLLKLIGTGQSAINSTGASANFTFATANVERVRLTANGLIGLNESDPSSGYAVTIGGDLNVSGNVAVTNVSVGPGGLRFTNSTGSSMVTIDPAGITTVNSSLVIGNNTGNSMTIDMGLGSISFDAATTTFSFKLGATNLLTFDTGYPLIEVPNLKLTAQNPAPTCIGGNVGQIYYDTTNETFYGCNNTGWMPLNEAAA